MSKSATPQSPVIEKYARLLVRHFFPRKKVHIRQLDGGLNNFVYAVKAGKEKMVVRISNDPGKINVFLKEQWAVTRAKEKKIPVAEIFEVGDTTIPLPYMITEKIDGVTGMGHPERKNILFQLGELAAIIHTIPTRGYGYNFGWSENELSVNNSWPVFLKKELNAGGRLQLLTDKKMISTRIKTAARRHLKEMAGWDRPGKLQHGDLRLKNVLVNQKGKIQALIDWENCISAIGPTWDLSIGLHDLPLDGQQCFLQGYGLTGKKLIDFSNYIKTFNLLNYAPVVEEMVAGRKTRELNFYRARLHGALDMFSL